MAHAGLNELDIEMQNFDNLDEYALPHPENLRNTLCLFKLGIVRIYRTEFIEKRTLHLVWRASLKTRNTEDVDSFDHTSIDSFENAKSDVIFLTKKIIVAGLTLRSTGPSIIKRSLRNSRDRNDCALFLIWLRTHYPNLCVSLRRSPKQVGASAIASAVALILSVTVTWGALTRFSVHDVGYAVCYLLWLYGSFILRWLYWALNATEGKYRGGGTMVLTILLTILGVPITLGVYAGVTAASVGLFGEACRETISLSVGKWTGVSIAIIYGIVGAGALAILLEPLLGT